MGVAFELQARIADAENQYEAALTFDQQSVALLEAKAPNSIHLAKALFSLGRQYIKSGMKTNALSKFELSAAILKRRAPRSLLLRDILLSIAELIPPSEQLELLEELKHDVIDEWNHATSAKMYYTNTASACYRIGQMYANRDMLQEAYLYYKRAVLNYEREGIAKDELPYGLALFNLAVTAQNIDKDSMAWLKWFSDALRIFELIDPTRSLYGKYMERCEVYKKHVRDVGATAIGIVCIAIFISWIWNRNR